MPTPPPLEIARPLLAWYDVNARELPWRNPPGAPPPEPYRVWLSEVMLQQTTVAAVKAYFARFAAAWPTIAALAAADESAVMAAWAGLGYYSRARNLLASARLVAAAGKFPDDEAALRALPGIGAYTAAAIAAIAFGRRAVVIDGNVERVVARLFAVATPVPAARPQLRALADTITPETRCGDFAQAMMDLGATICTPTSPRCVACPLAVHCAARVSGAAASFPRRLAKVPRPERRAVAWWIERDGDVWLVRRDAMGLLGGMRALPSTLAGSAGAGVAIGAGARAPIAAPAAAGATVGMITHVFTHFRLSLDVVVTSYQQGCVLPPNGEWWPVDRLGDAGLPTVFAKAAALAMRRRE